MPKTEIAATELTDGKVEFVSMVKRGANRIPFRIIKSEGGVLNLSSLFGRGATADISAIPDLQPVVTKVVMPKSETEGELEKQIEYVTGLGFKTDELIEGDNYRAFVQSKASTDEVAFKLDDSTNLVIAHAKKAFMDLGGPNEGNSFAAEGFFCSFYNAMDLLSCTIWDTMTDSNSSEEAAVSIAKTVDDFKNYVGVITRAIPATAWKADKAVGVLRQKREFDTKAREQLSQTGAAMPDGSFPILNEKDMHDAVSLMHDSKHPVSEVKSHIVARAHALGLSDKLPAELTQKADKMDLQSIVKSIVEGKQTVEFLKALAKADSGEVSGYISGITGMKVDDIVTVLGSNSQTAISPELNVDQGRDYGSGIGNGAPGVSPLTPSEDGLTDENFLKSDAAKAMLKSVQDALTAAMAPVTEGLKKMDERLGAVEAGTAEAKDLAQKTEKTLATTVVGGVAIGDTPARSTTQKSEVHYPLLDTGFMSVE